MVGPQGRREQVRLACQRGLSERRACGLIGVARSTMGYVPQLPVKDAPVVEAMRTLSAQYPRYGYRRIRIFLRRQGIELAGLVRIASGVTRAFWCLPSGPESASPQAGQV